jgi:hypothetical protein
MKKFLNIGMTAVLLSLLTAACSAPTGRNEGQDGQQGDRWDSTYNGGTVAPPARDSMKQEDTVQHFP